MTVFEIIAAAVGVGVGIVVMFGGVVAITLYVSKISSKMDGVVAKIDEIVATMSKFIDHVHDLGERTAKLEGRVDELSQRGVPPRTNDSTDPPGQEN